MNLCRLTGQYLRHATFTAQGHNQCYSVAEFGPGSTDAFDRYGETCAFATFFNAQMSCILQADKNLQYQFLKSHSRAANIISYTIILLTFHTFAQAIFETPSFKQTGKKILCFVYTDRSTETRPLIG